MNDSNFPTAAEGALIQADSGEAEAIPEFGVIDIVEAFTAMRHEWRGQTKETRIVADQIQAAVVEIQTLESKLARALATPQSAADAPSREAEVHPLAMALVETDHQFTRAIAAITQWQASCRERADADARLLESYFAGMNAVARWFGKPLFAFVMQQRSSTAIGMADAEGDASPAVAGLELVLMRLRRVMNDNGVERIETLGQPFDAETMFAIGSVSGANCPSGHVAEQVSPAYRWRGRVLRFADVRVAE